MASIFPSHFSKRAKSPLLIIFGTVLLLHGLAWPRPALADSSSQILEDTFGNKARTAWMDGSPGHALSILEEGLQEMPASVPLQKLRGDILATTRRNQEATDVYEAILQQQPDLLDVRWANWSVLTRMGKGDLAISQLRRIAESDSTNPLIHLQLGHELRKLDRLEESVKSYRQAVQLAPEFSGWRLDYARALFDVLQYDAARKEVERVLTEVPRGSPVELAARNLLMIVYGATKERGRRYQPIFSPIGSAAERKRWALIRPKAWTLYTKGQFREAEPLFREVLALKPSDYKATYEFGSTLMELGKYEEAISFLQKSIELGPAGGDLSEIFLDSIFRIGKSLTHLERWEEALLHFEILHEIASAPADPTGSVSPDANGTRPNRTKPKDEPQTLPATPSGKFIDPEKLAVWMDKVWQHIPKPKKPVPDFNEALPEKTTENSSSTFYTDMASKKFNPDQPVHVQASLMGRDADFSWFRYVIPSEQVMRDDLMVGSHEFIPLNPGNSFSISQEEIYLVFALVTASYDEVPLTATCSLETAQILSDQMVLTQDQVVMSMNEQSGYFVLSAPESGWIPGLYQCGLFVGEEVSAYTLADEVRFRIQPENSAS